MDPFQSQSQYHTNKFVGFIQVYYNYEVGEEVEFVQVLKALSPANFIHAT